MSRPLVTVKTLVTQSRDHGRIELPANALITPAAQDWLRSSGVPVRRTDATAAPENPAPTVYLIGDGQTSTLQTLLPILERKYDNLKFLSCHGHLAGCLEALTDVCAALSACSQRRAVVIVRAAAIVSCIANKCPDVRAAIASGPSALSELRHRLGINLLILEPGQTSLRQMQAMIDGFLAGKTEIDPVIESALLGVPTVAKRNEAAICSTGG